MRLDELEDLDPRVRLQAATLLRSLDDDHAAAAVADWRGRKRQTIATLRAAIDATRPTPEQVERRRIVDAILEAHDRDLLARGLVVVDGIGPVDVLAPRLTRGVTIPGGCRRGLDGATCSCPICRHRDRYGSDSAWLLAIDLARRSATRTDTSRPATFGGRDDSRYLPGRKSKEEASTPF